MTHSAITPDLRYRCADAMRRMLRDGRITVHEIGNGNGQMLAGAGMAVRDYHTLANVVHAFDTGGHISDGDILFATWLTSDEEFDEEFEEC